MCQGQGQWEEGGGDDVTAISRKRGEWTVWTDQEDDKHFYFMFFLVMTVYKDIALYII